MEKNNILLNLTGSERKTFVHLYVRDDAESDGEWRLLLI